MGNTLSEEEETEILEEAYSMSLESPEADKVLNAGTAEPNCQPKHSNKADERDDGGNLDGDDRTGDKTGADDRRKRQQAEQQTMSQQKKLSYIQMARLGYQELVNAIIRPPRADYKVRFATLTFS